MTQDNTRKKLERYLVHEANWEKMSQHQELDAIINFLCKEIDEIKGKMK